MLLRSVRRLAEPRPYAIHASIQIVCLTLRISYTSFWSELPVQRCACVTACHAVYVWVCVCQDVDSYDSSTRFQLVSGLQMYKAEHTRSHGSKRASRSLCHTGLH